jgi:hypothetical protein
MLNRFSNITLIVLCALLVVGIVITRNVDTAIEVNENRKSKERKQLRDFEIDCSGNLQKIVLADTSTWMRIEYTLPSFSSYNLDRKAGAWFMDTMQTDAAATATYLGKIANAQSSCRVVYGEDKALKMADYVLKIITNSSDTFTYSTFVVDTNLLVQVPNGQLYYGNSDSLFSNLYFGKFRFIPSLAGQ